MALFVAHSFIHSFLFIYRPLLLSTLLCFALYLSNDLGDGSDNLLREWKSTDRRRIVTATGRYIKFQGQMCELSATAVLLRQRMRTFGHSFPRLFRPFAALSPPSKIPPARPPQKITHRNKKKPSIFFLQPNFPCAPSDRRPTTTKSEQNPSS